MNQRIQNLADELWEKYSGEDDHGTSIVWKEDFITAIKEAMEAVREKAADLTLKRTGYAPEPVAWMNPANNAVIDATKKNQVGVGCNYPNFSIPLYPESARITAALAEQDDCVRVPRYMLERVEASLGAFVGDEGWCQKDMDTYDDVAALLAAAKEPSNPLATPAATAEE